MSSPVRPVLAMLVCALVPAAAAGATHYVPDLEYRVLAQDQEPAPPGAVLGSGEWRATDQASPNFGYDERVYWFRFRPRVPADEPVERLVSVGYAQLDDLRFYLVRNGEVVDQLITGDRRSFTNRAVHHPYFLFPVTLKPPHDYQVLVRVATQGAIQLPLEVWAPVELFEHLNLEDQAHALYYGILLIIIFFNLVLFLVLRERTYIYYVLTITSYLLFVASLRGTAFAVLWPDWPWLHNQLVLVTVPATILFSALFARSFLRLPENNPVLDRLARGGIVLGGLAVAGAFVLDYSLSTRLSVMLALPSSAVLLVIGPIEWARGNRAAKFYTLAWVALTLGGLLLALNKLGILPTNVVTEYGVQIGSAAEAILLTLALVERLYRERSERIQAQDQRLREYAERRAAELQLVDQALHHRITGLPNRTSFELALNGALSEAPDQRHLILVLQIINYQDILKTLGHANTEELITAIAARLDDKAGHLPGIRWVEDSERARYRASSLETARLALLLTTEDEAAISAALHDLVETLREPFAFLGLQLPLNIQAGFAVYPDHGDEASTLIRRAFIAQESDQARVHHLARYQPNSDIYSTERLTLAADLRRALEAGDLALHFQPQLAYADDRISGLEALLRWPGRDLGPDVVVALAEETGLIKPLTRWALKEAMTMRQHLLDAGHPDVSVSVNVSANNLQEPDFISFVRALLDARPWCGQGLMIELTETAMMVDPRIALRVLGELNEAGVQVAIDDFGSGYSSLSYLKQLPASELKIDKALIQDIQHRADARLIVRTTVEMSHNLGYSVVGEGVEDATMAELLRELGCDRVQGFYLAPALPPDEVVTWLNESVGSA
jgi:EAL domain-containing protein (putative c-di-GMP-specific phosphodiesterase class I)/GGDEF domain-containing protein